MRLGLPWVIRDYFQVAVYQRGAAGRVLVMGGLAENLRLLHAISRRDHVICYTVGDYSQEHYETWRKVAELFELDIQRVRCFAITRRRSRWPSGRAYARSFAITTLSSTSVSTDRA